MAAKADSTGIPSLNSRDAETGGAASESGCSISTLLLYQGESQNLVHTQIVVQHIGLFGPALNPAFYLGVSDCQLLVS